MVRIITLLVALCVAVITVSAQRNMTFISNFDYDEGVTDVWGHVTPDGIEYALIGTTEGFSIVSLADPTQPEELQFIPGQSTSWRDIKTWGEFAYVVSDNTSEGLLIVDMSTLPQDTAVWQYWTGPITELNEFLLNSHNIYIDEYGLAYLAGSNLGAIVSLDVRQDPWSPVFIAQTPGPYAHDVFVRDSVVYASEIYRGEISVVHRHHFSLRTTPGCPMIARQYTPRMKGPTRLSGVTIFPIGTMW